MKVLLRLQSRANNEGPYRQQDIAMTASDMDGKQYTINKCQSLCEYLYGRMSYTDQHPSPSEEIWDEYFDMDRHIFAFSNVEQLLEWFSVQDCQKMSNFFGDMFDYSFAVYVCTEDYFIGKKQCIFNEEYATLHTWIEPEMLANEEYRSILDEQWQESIIEQHLIKMKKEQNHENQN